MFKKIHFKEIDSTHAYALRELSQFEGQSIFITTDVQTAGIGRKGTHWISGKKTDLLITFVFPAPTNHPLHNLAQLLAISNLHALESLSFSPLFKWPNDLLLSYKKVSGVMGEVSSNMAIVSAGINVNTPPEAFYSVDQPATSLFVERSTLFDLNQLEEIVVEHFSASLTLFTKEGFSPFLKEISSHLAFKNELVTIDGHAGTLKGIDSMGRLLLKTAEGELSFANGTLRPSTRTT